MYPNLSYFFHDVFGTDPDNIFSLFQTFGFFLVLAILTAAYFFKKELQRKRQQGFFAPSKVTTVEGGAPNWMDLILSAAFTGLFLYKIVFVLQNWSAFLENPKSIVLTKEGNLLAGIITFLLYGAYRYWEITKDNTGSPKKVTSLVYPDDQVTDIAMVGVISGLIGAKLFALVEDLPAFFADPIGSFFSGAGMAIYGGLIGGFLGGYIYLKSKKVNPLHVMDAVAPSLMISYAVGRLGCQFSGDGDWGIPVKGPNEWVDTAYDYSEAPSWLSWLPDWCWSYTFPHNVLNDGPRMPGCEWEYCSELPIPVFPTSIYEVVMATLLFLFLWSIRKKFSIPGLLFCVYVFLNGMERFFIEYIRVNPTYELFGWTTSQAQVIAVVLMLIGILGGAFLLKRGKVATQVDPAILDHQV